MANLLPLYAIFLDRKIRISSLVISRMSWRKWVVYAVLVRLWPICIAGNGELAFTVREDDTLRWTVRCMNHSLIRNIPYWTGQQLSQLYVADIKAMNHISMNSYNYPKPHLLRHHGSRLVGSGECSVRPDSLWAYYFHRRPGLLIVEGDEHKQQVPILSVRINLTKTDKLW